MGTERGRGGYPLGVACIAGACAAWALDNNLSQRLLSQRLSIRDPFAVVRAKTLAAGAFNVALGLVIGERLPTGAHVGGALLTGAFGYGMSLVLPLLAVRSLGAARQAAYFATAPFVGALVAIPLLHDHLPAAHLAAGALMSVGIAVIVRAHHAHGHEHEPVDHEHAHVHVHDQHHAHTHQEPVTEPHSHPHQHAPLVHDHPHLPDTHHRHRH